MVTIKKITEADKSDWLKLWEGYLVFYKATLTPDVTETTFERILSVESDVFGSIARDESGAAVGFVHWLTHRSTWSITNYTYLEDLFVSPDVRGGGVGRALIEHVREWSIEHESSKLYWLTADDNAQAQILYDKVATKTGFIHYEINLG